MQWKEDDLPALRELECAIIRLWPGHEEMNDYTAARAYEAAYQFYRARLRGHDPKPNALTGVDLEVYHAVCEVCGKLLTSGATPISRRPQGNTQPLHVAKLVEYLRELMRSVERHTKLGGRRGYLEFVRGFIP